MARKRQGDTQIVHGDERDRYGCIVTFADPLERRFITLHRAGKVTAALEECLDLVPPPWGVVCISTPNTVYGDVSDARTTGEAAKGNTIEVVLLARIHHPGRLHQRLWPKPRPGRDKYRAAHLRELEAWRAASAPPPSKA